MVATLSLGWGGNGGTGDAVDALHPTIPTIRPTSIVTAIKEIIGLLFILLLFRCYMKENIVPAQGTFIGGQKSPPARRVKLKKKHLERRCPEYRRYNAH